MRSVPQSPPTAQARASWSSAALSCSPRSALSSPTKAAGHSRTSTPRSGRAADGAGAEAAARAYHTLSDAARQSGIASQGQADVWSQITWFGLQAFGFTPMVYAGERSN